MKKIIIVFAFFIFCAEAFAQLSLVCSLNPSASISSYKGLNYVINRYNDTRRGQNGAALLTNPMNNIQLMASLGWRLGVNIKLGEYNGVLFAMNRVGRRAHTFAEGRDANGTSIRRDLRFTANSFNLESGFYIGGGSEGYMLSAGGSLDLISHNAYTRRNNEPYKLVMDEFNVGVSFFLQGDLYVHNNLSIGLRPSYQYIPITTSYSGLNEAINPITATADSKESQSSTGSNFTLSLMLNFVLGED